jgi:hypothetical protein
MKTRAGCRVYPFSSIALFVYALLFTLAGCGSPDKPQPLAGPQLHSARRALAFTALEAMRAAFNRGECGAIFDDADPIFRRLQTKEEWVSNCEVIRNRLGSWNSFTGDFHEALDAPLTVALRGQAAFAKGACRMNTTWHIDSGRFRLFSFACDAGEVHILAPRVWPPRRGPSPPGN